MLRRGAIANWTTRSIMIAAWTVSFFAIGTACADTQSIVFGKIPITSVNDQLRIDIECSDRHIGNTFCGFKTDIQYSKYLNTPWLAHEYAIFSDNEQDQRQADILAIFRLAVEEFKFLSGARFYWELTEKNLEELAIKLRLKGEITLNDRDLEKPQKSTNLSLRRSKSRKTTQKSALSLIMPSKIRWNLGMDPNDLTVFGELSLNNHLSLNGEFGDTSQVGLYFRYAF